MANMVIVVKATRNGGTFFCSATIPVENYKFHAKKAVYDEYPAHIYGDQRYILPQAFKDMVSS